MMDRPLTPAERFPLITERGQRTLEWLREHSHAPVYTMTCGDRLTAAGLRQVREFESELSVSPARWQPGEVPDWLARFTRICYQDVPFYRRYGAQPSDFFAVPTTQREDLGREPWAFVPDSLPLDDLIVYTTSGTTGHPLNILSHPVVSSMYLPLLKAALATCGITLEDDSSSLIAHRSSLPGRVAIILVCAQNRTFTYATISSYLDGAGFAKINLNPADWRDPADRVRFLDACNPEVYTGDPISFAALSELPLHTHPKALISSALSLLPSLHQALEARFGCPVLDVYAMNETGPMAVKERPVLRGALVEPPAYSLLQPHLYVEILDDRGQPCPPGRWGEVTVSGGFNPFLPLLRYRTGDSARMAFRGRQPLLLGLEGRLPTVFHTPEGKRVNNIDVSVALRPFALSQFTLHQFADGRLLLRVRGTDVDQAVLRQAMLGLFGPSQNLTLEEVDTLATTEGKVLQYTTAMGNEMAAPKP